MSVCKTTLHRSAIVAADGGSPNYSAWNTNDPTTGVNLLGYLYALVEVKPSDPNELYSIEGYRGTNASGDFYEISDVNGRDQTSISGNQAFLFRVDGGVFFLSFPAHAGGGLSIDVFVTPIEQL